jgi:hypothetical protein
VHRWRVAYLRASAAEAGLNVYCPEIMTTQSILSVPVLH